MSDENATKPNGLGVDPMLRLASFKPPRDYSLGPSKPIKKVFTPNLNVTRNKNKGSSSNNARDHKNNEKGKRERKNDRNKNFRNGPNVIKSGGVFAEGLGSAERSHNHRSSYGGRDMDPPTTMLKRPTIRVKDVIKIDKELEEQKIKMMMERGSASLVEEEDFKEAIHNEAPINLPMDDIGWSLSKRKPLLQVKQEVMIKTEPDLECRIPTYPNLDLKPVVKKDPYEDTDVVDILRAASPGLMLIKFPDTLPGRGVGEDDGPPRRGPGTEPSTSSAAKEENTKNDRCYLKQLEEGRIGKLLVRRSGRVTLQLGNSEFEVNLGTKSAFHQEVVSVGTNEATQSACLVSLGPIEHKLTVVPAWDDLFRELPS